MATNELETAHLLPDVSKAAVPNPELDGEQHPQTPYPLASVSGTKGARP